MNAMRRATLKDNCHAKILALKSESEHGNNNKITGSESEKNEFGSTTLSSAVLFHKPKK
jgi:hypothetical protein